MVLCKIWYGLPFSFRSEQEDQNEGDQNKKTELRLAHIKFPDAHLKPGRTLMMVLFREYC